MGEERADHRAASRSRLVEGRRRLGDRLLDERPRDAGERGERGVEVDEHLGLDLGDRRDLGGGRGSGVDEPRRAGCSATRRFRITGVEAPEQRRAARPSAALRSGPRPASALPNSNRFSWIAAAGRLVERAQHLVDLDRLRVARRSAASPALRDSPRRRSPRSISRYLRPSAERARTITVESIGQRVDVGVELQVEAGAVRCRPRADTGSIVLDQADAHAADADLVAGHERGRRRGPGRREPVGGHERQAAVRVVGEEDGEDRRPSRSARRPSSGSR